MDRDGGCRSRSSQVKTLLVKSLLLLVLTLRNSCQGQKLNKAALQYNAPDIFMYTSASEYDPYVPLTTRQVALSEYVIVHAGRGVQSIHIMYYDPQTTNASEQSLRREYYWRFLNTSGVSPGATLLNTTFRVPIPFTTRPNDVIAYHSTYRISFFSSRQYPIYDVVMEYPANSGHLKRFISVVEYSSFPLIRWRYSDDFILTWEQILNRSMSLRPAYPPPTQEFNNTYHAVSPQDLQMLENPCARDLFAFYLIAQRRQDHSAFQRFGPVTHVYFSVPLGMGKDGPDWIDMTQAFCPSYSSDCGKIESLTLTNAHLLAVSDRGIFVSEDMTSAPLRFLDYFDLPLLAFHLIDPCSLVRDLFYCYTPSGLNSLIHRVTLHYVPICHIHQLPNYRDIVILVIGHDTINENQFLRNPVAWTVLYAEQPYTDWKLLVKSAISFDNFLLHDLKGAYFNYQLNHFDFVAQVGHDRFPKAAYDTNERWYVRFILPMAKKADKPGYYEILSTELGNGFLPKIFPLDFEFRKIEVSAGSLDIHYVGNQIWISESGGRFVYLSVGHLSSEIEYCNFNHPDRYFICVNIDHTQVLVGKISAYYRAHEIHVDDFSQLRDVALEEGWFISPSSRFDSKLARFINPGYASEEGRVFAFLARPILQKAIKGIFYRVSQQGNIQIWYMEAGMKNDHSLLPEVAKVIHFEDALSITTSDGARPPVDVAQMFADAEQAVANKIDVFRTIFHSKLSAKSATPARMALISIKADIFLPFERQEERPSLVPFLVDGITVVLFEARMPGSTGFTRTDVGNTIHCIRRISGGQPEESCELYIRHIKFLDDSWIQGFAAVAYAYILKSIPMHAFSCLTRITVNPRSNDAFIYINKEDIDAADPSCSTWTTDENFHYIGWTFYIPGHFSILITLLEPDSLPDQKPPLDRTLYVDTILYGKATRKFDRQFEVELTRYEGFFINMASIGYQQWKYPPTDNVLNRLSPEELYPSLPSWYTHPSVCLFELLLLPNPVLRSTGGVVALNLHDSLSFTISITAIHTQGEVMMQQVRLKVTNSNPSVLSLRQNLIKQLTTQTIAITVRPTGFSIGQSTVVVRALSCLPNCDTPCSLTFIFQVMRAEGQRLTIHYPITLPAMEILNPNSDGNVVRNNTIIYQGLPVNYRPPSVHGVAIPLSTNIYNSDPSKPLYRTTYKVSKVSGVYSKCRDKVSRAECGCSPSDILDDHPFYTDCKERIYRVRRAAPFNIRATYPPRMDPALQHQMFFIEKHHLVVWVEEINGREDYSLESSSDSYLKNINNNLHLHRGKRFYNAEGLTFTVYGTGIYHFRVALGEFDTFDDMSGYFTVISEDLGMDDFSFMIYFFSTMIFAFVFTLCSFLRVRKQLIAHIPIREIVDDGKVTKVE